MNESIPFLVKARGILKGFFGWVILGNVIFVLLFFLQLKIDANLDDNVVLAIVWLPTVTAILVLFIKKRIGIGVGVVSAVIMNVGIWMRILSFPGSTFPGFTVETILIMGMPLPSGILIFMLMQ
jgi:hypothetical protein